MPDDKNNVEMADPRVYELGYLLVPSLGEGEVAGAVETIKGYLDAPVFDEGTPEMIDLAYQMEYTVGNKTTKVTTAHFGWVKFEVTGETIETINQALAKDPNVIRHLLVSTVKESTRADKKVADRKAETAKKARSVKPATESVDEQALDKQLEEITTS